MEFTLELYYELVLLFGGGVSLQGCYLIVKIDVTYRCYVLRIPLVAIYHTLFLLTPPNQTQCPNHPRHSSGGVLICPCLQVTNSNGLERFEKGLRLREMDVKFGVSLGELI